MSRPEIKTQLTSVENFDVNRIIFSEYRQQDIPNSKLPPYGRVNISVRNPDGTIGDLVLETEELFSFGVSENVDATSKLVTGHTLPICLWSRGKPTDREKKFTDTFNEIVEYIKAYMIKNREALHQYELEAGELTKFNPLYFKKEKGKVVEGTGPTLYAKLITSKRDGENKIKSVFYNEEGEQVDPLTLKGKYCYVKCAIKIESIFLGGKKSLQVKVYEASFRPVENYKPLLVRPKNSGRMIGSDAAPPAAEHKAPSQQQTVLASKTDEDIIEDEGSLNGSDTEIVPVIKQPQPPAKPQRKIVKAPTLTKK